MPFVQLTTRQGPAPRSAGQGTTGIVQAADWSTATRSN
jgi:hypothetical protein